EMPVEGELFPLDTGNDAEVTVDRATPAGESHAVGAALPLETLVESPNRREAGLLFPPVCQGEEAGSAGLNLGAVLETQRQITGHGGVPREDDRQDDEFGLPAEQARVAIRTFDLPALPGEPVGDLVSGQVIVTGRTIDHQCFSHADPFALLGADSSWPL